MSEAKQEAERLPYTIPEAGALAGLNRNASYDAAKRGEIPTIKFGSRFRVPRAKWDRIVAGEAA
jgi:excisionase family DNA binding protein